MGPGDCIQPSNRTGNRLQQRNRQRMYRWGRIRLLQGNRQGSIRKPWDPGRQRTGSIHRCHRNAASHRPYRKRSKSHGTEAWGKPRGRPWGSKSHHDNRYREERGSGRDRDRWKNRNSRRYVQGLRNDPPQHVYDAWIYHQWCGYLKGTSSGSTQRGYQGHLQHGIRWRRYLHKRHRPPPCKRPGRQSEDHREKHRLWRVQKGS